MIIQAILAVVLCQTASARDGYPVRVRNLLSPQQTGTSQFEWTVTWVGGADDGLVERYVTRTADDTAWESNLGDENGFHRAAFAPPQEGTAPAFSTTEFGPSATREEIAKMGLVEVPKERNAGIQNSLLYKGDGWYLKSDKPTSGFLAPAGDAQARTPRDPRALGLRVGFTYDWMTDAFGMYRIPSDGFESAQYSEGYENGRPTVSAEYGARRLTWTFDKQQGGMPVQAVLYQGDSPMEHSETQYQEVAGRWIPKSVRFYLGDSPTPYKIIEVQRATFDEPWHMREITPETIGPVFGTSFSMPEGKWKVWDGFELMDSDEFWETASLYDLLPDRRILELRAQQAGISLDEFIAGQYRYNERVRNHYFREHGEKPWLDVASPKKEKEKDEWDVYVEKFLAEHKLPEPAVTRAKEIRDQAKKLRDAYRHKNAAELRKAKAENDSRKVAHFEGIEKNIFDRVLVRSLEKLVHDEKDAPKKEP